MKKDIIALILVSLVGLVGILYPIDNQSVGLIEYETYHIGAPLEVNRPPSSNQGSDPQSPEPTEEPVVILYKEKPSKPDFDDITSKGGKIKKSFTIIHGVSADLPPQAIEHMKRNPRVASVDPDIEMKLLDSNANTQIGAASVFAGGYTGNGVRIAILDTGIDTTHPEFSGRVMGCHSEFNGVVGCQDGNKHGTHVAGIVGASGVSAQARGVAPGASLYIDQVLNATGSGSLSLSIAGIDWAVAQGADIISMSLGSSPVAITQPNCDTVYPSMTAAINNAVAAGVTVVAAAGNVGASGVGLPACISTTIAVAAVDSANTVATFSSRGPPLSDHGISAPGVNIYSTLLGGSYGTLSGTSMATPVVSGAIALLLEKNPTLSPSEIKSLLFSTACKSPSCPTGSTPNNDYGHGRIDVSTAFSSLGWTLPTLEVSTITDKTTYRPRSKAKITTTTSSSGSRVNGATVTLTIKPPTGASTTITLTTSSTGTAILAYTIGKTLGTYTVETKSSAPGYTPSATRTTTFNVS